jgi:citrate synthase
MPTSEEDWARTWIGSSTPDSITVAGRDLPGEVMGALTLTELTYLLVTRRDPTEGQRRVLDAVLVSLADHGLTPSALAARLTYTGAPEAIQGAVAAGLLGAGSVFLGPTGDTAEFLVAALAGQTDPDDAALRRIALAAVDARLTAGLRVPGLGHPVHKVEDPRTRRLYEIAEREGVLGPHLRLLTVVATIHQERTGKRLPVNGAGAGGAALVDIGLPPESVRGVVLIARTAGLVAHLVEEASQPVGMPLYLEVERRASPDES